MKYLFLLLSLTATAANAQTVQCRSEDGTTISITAGIINTKPGETGPADTHTAVVKMTDGKSKAYSVHGVSEGSNLAIASYLGFDDVRFKLKLENYNPTLSAYPGSSAYTLQRILVDVKNPETGELKYTASKRVKEEYSVNCNVAGSFPFRNSCSGKSAVQSSSQLLQAARSANIESAEEALTCGADVNIQDKNGCTPLIAAIENEKELCRNEKVPPLDPIFSNRAELLAEMFLDEGAFYDAQDKNGRAAIHRAVTNRFVADKEILQVLIDLEANLNVQDKDGVTPLMLAAKLGLQNAVYELVNAGADISVKDKKGRTALTHGEKLYPAWLKDMLSGVTKEFVITGSSSTCSPLTIEIPKGERVRLKLLATDNMYMLTVPGLKVNLMASASGTADQVIQAASAGTFAFECGLHGGALTEGTIIAK